VLKILRDAGLSALADDSTLVTLADGFQFTEGPLWLPDGSLLVQDIKAEESYRVREGRPKERLREQTGAANGQTFLPDGRIVVCEQNGRRLSTLNADGTGVATLAETWEGKHLNSPNDVVSRSDGLIYFTDPPYGVKPEDREIPFQGVYSMVIGGGDGLRLVRDDFEKPNGLAFSPDERTLYVNDTGRYHVRAFAVEPSGAVESGPGRVVATMDPTEKGGPDGLKVDREGRLYVAVAEGVWVYEPDGKLLGIIAVPKRPSNLAWCDDDASGLAITAIDAVYKVRLKARGVTPPFLPASKSPTD